MNKTYTKNGDLRPYLLDLLEGGMSQAAISREIGLTRATVNVAVRRREAWMPGYEAGRLLVSLWKKKKKQRGEA